MNTEYNKISILETTPFDKLRANGINQSFLNKFPAHLRGDGENGCNPTSIVLVVAE